MEFPRRESKRRKNLGISEPPRSHREETEGTTWKRSNATYRT